MIESPVFAVMLTFGVYFFSSKLYSKFKFFLLNPILLSIVSIIVFLKIFNIDYDTYFAGAKIISFFLPASVVALGVPLYLQLGEIKKRGFSIILSTIIGSTVGILSAALTAKFLGASREVVASIAPKSVTTPIAMSISDKIGGIPPLTAALVICTGIFGAILGPAILKLFKIKDKVAFGLAMGSASHGIGTAKAAEEGQLEGAVSGLAICLNGVATAILTPILFKLIYLFL